MKKRILVVDDAEQIRQSLLRLLQTEGYEVVLAEDGAEALKKFHSESIDLLLLDLNLPKKSGWDVFERITAINPLLPTIVITGIAKQSEIAVAAGVGALMEKPLDVPLLLKSIAELLLESPEQRLKRLVGLEKSTRYFRAPSVRSLVPSRLERSKPGKSNQL